jgi:resuscitation-promoting factor RpfB
VPGTSDRRRPVRRSPLTVAASAVVLALLCGGTTAFALLDKTVTLDVDGQRSTVRTLSGTVGGTLRQAHMALGQHDTVAPDLSAPVHDGSRVIVRHGRLLTLRLDGRSRQVWVTALSVNDALDELGLRADGEWMSVSRSLSIPRSGLSFEVRMPQHVTVLVDGHRLVTQTTAPSVSSLLGQLRLHLHRLDHISVPLVTYPTDGMVVTVDRISQGTVNESVAIAFATERVDTSSLYVGQTAIRRYGEPGVRQNTYRLLWKNRRLVKRTLVSSRVVQQPTAQVIAVGTTPRPVYSPSADGLNWGALAQCESGGNPRAVSPDGRFRGLYQFTLDTWHSLGGSGDPIDASSSEQTYRAQLLYRRAGDAPWPTCGHYLYS